VKKKLISSGLSLVMILVLSSATPGRCSDGNQTKPSIASAPETLSIEAVFERLENRYQSPSFSARFYQESPLPDIQITETAEGKAFFKKPGNFRWSYEKPERLDYISNGKTLWIYSLIDNNVWIGKADTFFGKAGSAAVLTDVTRIREKFDTSIDVPQDPSFIRIKLVPKDMSLGLHAIYLSIDTATFTIKKIVSFNMNGEETRITFSDIVFDSVTDDSLFSFTVPENAVIIPLD
jgi:outer membrane lipoprotein carrier protein